MCQEMSLHVNVHTQTIHGVWSLLKRGIIGTFHDVNAKYLPLYAAAFERRYNNRGNPDNFGVAVGRCRDGLTGGRSSQSPRRQRRNCRGSQSCHC
jgi:hypothetical protein